MQILDLQDYLNEGFSTPEKLLAGNKAKRLLSVNHDTKPIHHHQRLDFSIKG